MDQARLMLINVLLADHDWKNALEEANRFLAAVKVGPDREKVLSLKFQLRSHERPKEAFEIKVPFRLGPTVKHSACRD